MKFGKLLLLTVALVFTVPTLWGQTFEKVRLKNYDMAVPFASTQGLRLSQGELPLKAYDFVLEDINGKKYDLKQLLQSGKKIFIDFSAVWCGPCWRLHQYGTLTQLHNMYADKDLVVLWVEVEGAEKAVISQKGVGKNTQGDWTEGGKFPVSIVSDKYLASRLGISLSSVPSCYVLLPGGSYVEIDQKEFLLGYDNSKTLEENAKSGKSKEAAEAIYNRVKDLGLKSGDKPVVASVDIPTIVEGRKISFKAPKALSMHGFVRFNWTFEGGTPAQYEQKGTDDMPTVVWNKSGKQKITITPSDTNGKGTPYEVEVDVLAKTYIDKFPYEYSFEEDVIDPQWYIVDEDGDGHAWYTLQYHFKRVKYWNTQYAETLAHYGKNAAVSWACFPIDYDESQEGWISGQCAAKDRLLSPGIKIPADAQKPTAFFYVGDIMDEDGGNKAFSVRISTTTQEPEAFTTVLIDKEITKNHYSLVTLDLSAYKGKTVYIGIYHESDGKDFGLFVDDFGVSLDGTTPTTKPTPVLPLECFVGEKQLSLSACGLQEAALINAAGVQVAHTKGLDQLTMDITQLPAGVYVVIATGADKKLALRKVIIP